MSAEEVCERCGAELGVGRFCTNCGHPVGAPVPEEDDWRTGTAERPVYVVPPAEPAAASTPPEARYPLFADDFTPPPPAYGTPTSHRHAAFRPHQPRPAWVPVAAGVVALLMVAVLGGWLLFFGDDGDDTTPTAAEPTTAEATPTPTPSEEPTTEEPTPSEEPSEAEEPAEATNLAREATATVPATAPPSTDSAGNSVRYEARNMLDGVPETTWRMPGDGTGETLTFDFDSPVELISVGLVNGYAKTARDGGEEFDWYAGNRRVLAVEWLFDDGTLVRQDLEETRAVQSIDIDPVTTQSVQVRLVTVSEPGTGRASRDYTAVSEVSLVGSPTD